MRPLLSIWLLCCLGWVQAALASDNIKLTLAQSWPDNFPLLGEAPSLLAERVAKLSNGRLTIRVDTANKHKAPLEIFDMVRGGQYDMGHSASYFWKGKDPNTLYFTTMPFGMTAPEQFAWFEHGGGIQLMQQVYGKYGLLSFPGGNSGQQMGGWFRKPMNGLEDFQGLKMRIGGFAGEILAEVGAKPVNIAPGELYTALERNTIDALEWVGPAMDLRMGFHRIAPYYYGGWHEPAAETQFLINQKTWDKLPADLQAILRVAMRATTYDIYIKFQHANAIALQDMQRDFPEVQIRTFAPAVLSELKRVNDRLLDDLASADPLAKKIIESQRAYQKKVRAWTQISDQAYLNSMVE